MTLQQLKEWAAILTGMDDAALHALVGMTILMGASALLRRVPWSWQSWTVLLFVELGNEAHDMLNPLSGEDRLDASLHDIWITMFAPTLLLTLTPWLIRRAQGREMAKDEAA